jgi:UDP-glucose 4-epimerase
MTRKRAMRVLVTGTSGFIGTSFCERFARRGPFQVFGVDRLTPRNRVSGVQYHVIDLTYEYEVSSLVASVEPEVIVHLAAQARVDPSLASSRPTYSDNVVGTLSLLSACEKLGSKLQRFVYASSETVYGPASRYPVAEETPVNPQSPYAASKAACELLVGQALKEKALILRSGMGYGPRSDPRAQVVAKFATRALRDQPLFFPRDEPRGGHPTRDVNFVENFLDGLGQAVTASASGTFNVASGREVSILDIAHLVVDISGSGSVVFTPEFTYRPGEEGLRTWLDISKAKDAFGYSPRISLEEGLRRTIEWYRANPAYFDQDAPMASSPA